ncbi:RIP metalloprotease RseP [Maritimibacter sp. DP1N21-5]|uniref:RIP metalloprotease RseP n=1 Tax=Maritimibacter sp. DP1N21-5 TaxID=2836867 RepID=UPI001C4626AC|nr:RIP metalloprotease RseP [Maritimibacter sp. DP1N21-5]MBV7409790.1 RIP metalloprotease RseP [Maritimibacter sp. DP1N21-5]
MDMTGLIPDFGNLAFTLLAFVVALTIIVFIHEYGHYIVGKWTGIKADVFSIGIGPVLFKRTDKHGTQWQVAAFPVGGYVKFRGDANAASAGADEDAIRGLTPEERRATMPGAPVWARALTVAAGPVFNFVLSVLIFFGMAYYQGIATDPLTVKQMVPISGVENTLEPGDQILSIAGQTTPPLEEFGAYVETLPDDSPLHYVVLRDGAEVEVTTLHPYPAFVGSVTPQTAAADAGLEKGDLILAVNGTPTATFEDLRGIVGEGDGEALTLTIVRDGEQSDVTLTPRRMDLPLPEGGFETRWLIGIGGGLIFEPATRAPSIGEAITGGVSQVQYIITSSLSGLWHMITGAISSCNLRGPIGIAETSGAAASQGMPDFIWFIAVLSTAVGLLNLFPIPVLDGGHLVFHAYEAVVGRPPGDRAMRVLLAAGLAIILSIMVLGITNDLFCP